MSRTLSELEKTVGADPENPTLRHLLGAHYAQEGRYEEAERELYRAISLDPQAHLARMQLGLLYLTKKDVHRAISTLAALERLDDADPLKSFKRGLEALMSNDIPACRKWLEHGMARNESNPPLNHDMRLILTRLATPEASVQRKSPVPDRLEVERRGEMAPAREEPLKVRTDFSLYGTRH